MTYLIFIAIAGTIGIFGAFKISFRTTWPLGRLLLPALSIVFVTAALTEYFASFNDDIILKTFWTRLSVTLQFLIAVAILELSVSFLGKGGLSAPLSIGKHRIRLRFLWRPLAVVAIEISVLGAWFTYANDGSDIIISLSHLGEALFAVLFVYHLATLYTLEKIFRNSTTMQKRVFIPFIVSTGFIALGSMIFLIRILFYRQLAFETIQIHATLCAIFFPGILIGLARYRLWQEQIVIGRGMVYTSITILFFGLFLITLGLLASAIRFLGIHFNQFEAFVTGFVLLFIGVFTIFSPHMRTAITALSRKYIYKSKHDYRDQLLRFHAVHQAAGDVTQTIRAFIDNLRYTIIVKNAFIFLRSSNEDSFNRIDDGLSGSGTQASFRADSPLIRLFRDDTVAAVSVSNPGPEIVGAAVLTERATLDKLSISHLFPITHRNLLVGVLGIDCGNRLFDSEDLMLINIFCESIGTAIFRDRIERERIERKQFESFSHMASFIVHDIKNQIATLSLVTKNAKANITNADFHPVLLRSLENCSGNLNILIDKLKSPPKKEQLSKIDVDCTILIAELVDQLRAALREGISIDTSFTPVPIIAADATALSYILKNLLINAIEAIGKDEGRISCSAGALATITPEDIKRFGLTAVDREHYSIFIQVDDNGPGMSRAFIEQRLFKPFNTTKDKGVGIGLYQCKTLVDSMGGRLLCWSAPGEGTRFCILLS